MINKISARFWPSLLLVVVLTTFSFSMIQAQKVLPTWESINQRGYPNWFRDAKLGIFIHWGLYSVPAYASPEGYGEWYYKGLMSGDTGRLETMRRLLRDQGIEADSLISTPLYGYDKLPNLWHAEMWHPDEWADLFKKAGAQYVLLVTKHHDGYCLWDYPHTALPKWNSVESGPHRNIVAELTTAVRKKGMKMGFYYSLPEWTNPIHTWTSSPNDSIGRYVETYMIPQFKDLVSRYHPSVIFTDGDWDNTAEQLHARELISWYYNTVGPEAVVNDRWGYGHEHGFLTPEYSGGILDTVRPWAECRGVGRSFGVNRNEKLENFLTDEELIRHFVQLVAAGGGLTLNVGPNADGTIPFIQQERLLSLGKWLTTNGEAIYGSRPWIRPYDKALYTLERNDSAINFDWVRNAPDKEITVDSFNVTWSFNVVPKYSETYTFKVFADDEATLSYWDNETTTQGDKSVGGKMLCSSTKDTATYSLSLKAGKSYHFVLAYKEKDLEARVCLRWSSPSQQEEVIRPKDGFQAAYSCKKPVICYTTKGDNLYAIATEWPHMKILKGKKEAFLAIPYESKPSSKMNVSMLGCDKPIRWEWKNKQIIIHTDNLDYYDSSRDCGAWVFKLEHALAVAK
jgi:alpha-L-fucosidase